MRHRPLYHANGTEYRPEATTPLAAAAIVRGERLEVDASVRRGHSLEASPECSYLQSRGKIAIPKPGVPDVCYRHASSGHKSILCGVQRASWYRVLHARIRHHQGFPATQHRSLCPAMPDTGSVCPPNLPSNVPADLHSIYFLYAMRPLQSWNAINQASQNCTFLLRSGTIKRESYAYLDAFRRIYWICYIIDR